MREKFDFLAGIGDRWADNELHLEIGCLSIILQEHAGDWAGVPRCILSHQRRQKAKENETHLRGKIEGLARVLPRLHARYGDELWETYFQSVLQTAAATREERARAARAVGLLAEWFDPGKMAMCDAAANEPLSPLDELRRERARAVRAMDLGPGWVEPEPGCDVPRKEFGPPRTAQLDCIAETSNTTIFLLLLERDGLISRHRVR